MEEQKPTTALEPGLNFGLKAILMVAPALIACAIFIALSRYKYDIKSALHPMYNAMVWGLLPIVVYLLTTGCSLIAQYTACGSVHVTAVANSTWQIVLYVYAALAATQFTVVRAPVVSIMPFGGLEEINEQLIMKKLKTINDIITIEKMNPGLEEKAAAYYLFWAILYGQMSILGKSTVCKS
jgi:hypothetical protein